METKIQSRKLKVVQQKLGFEYGLEVNLVGRKGGLTFLCSSKVEMEIINYSGFHIYALVKETKS